ncbi:hypothetical protein UPYG_G00341890 [Umbra pygmaea]|uniref:VWFD domain-containing protein n=1 Tax=Umbra pygmaea TaxID=75934 RepID=A0ABD0WDG3_UMBPY
MGIRLPTFVLLLSGLCSAGPATFPPKTGTCWAMGDSHYRTFDSHYFNFMGNCTYTIAKNCHIDTDHPAFEVQSKNEDEHADSQVTSAGIVTIKVYAVDIDIIRFEFGLVRVNNQLWTLPITLENGKIQLYQSGFSVVLETDFGVTVQYNWMKYLVVTVPGSFAGKLCGMCGNFNSKQDDDLTTPSGSLARNVVALGMSWRVPDEAGDAYCRDQCNGQCETCKSDIVHRIERDLFCKFVKHVSKGPFKDCGAAIEPNIIYENCLYDLCKGSGMKTYLCDTLQIYTDICQRAGVHVYNWRRISHCPELKCPAHSHYEECGSACPPTCQDPDAHLKCKVSCVEACICDNGYLRSGNKCVPNSQCGCQYNGYYVEPGTSFWADESCTTLLKCSSTGGRIESQVAHCPFGQQCQVANGIIGCYPRNITTCMVSGDFHYQTFDGRHYNFQGTCAYQMVAVCSNDTSLEPFSVIIQKDGGTTNVGAIASLLEVKVYGYTVIISEAYPGSVMVNGELANLPVTLERVFIYKSGWFVVVETDFGLQVSNDWNSIASVTIPNTYERSVCGMCGNFNLNPNDDMQLKNGKPAINAEDLGQSWTLAETPGCVNGCTGPCPGCNVNQKGLYMTNDYCGLILDPTGPFRDCHSEVDPMGFFQDCLDDVCLYQGSSNMHCKTLTAYTDVCQKNGALVYSWRSDQFCDAKCPVNSHYSLCAQDCQATCQSLSEPTGCNDLCKEGCVCDAGFFLSGDQCVSSTQCGCLNKGRYYRNGQVFYSNNCQQECTCNGTVTCEPFSCGPNERCEVNNGIRSCQAAGNGVCSISGDPHYNTFDNSTYDFQGTCTYTAATSCHLDGTSLTPFSVVVENEKWYAMSSDPKVSVAKLVAVEVYGNIIILRRNQIGMIMVNGVLYNIPLSLNDGAVQIYQLGTNDVITTDFGLKVTYDLVYHITVTVPSNYWGKTCGLCGNFNGNKNDDFLLPDGQTVKDVNYFGASWKVSVPGVICEDGCRGDVCPKCDIKKKGMWSANCDIIIDPTGPLSACHQEIDPASYFRDCLFDVCMAEGERDMLCHSVAAYVLDCQHFGVKIGSWRSPNFCPLSCPDNSHYKLCPETCKTSCSGLTEIINCPTTCAEGCACDNNFFFNGTGCVKWEQCSCYAGGHTLKIGDSLVSDNCLEVYKCQQAGVVLSQPMACQGDQSCQVQDGRRGCYPSGNLHAV